MDTEMTGVNKRPASGLRSADHQRHRDNEEQRLSNETHGSTQSSVESTAPPFSTSVRPNSRTEAFARRKAARSNAQHVEESKTKALLELLPLMEEYPPILPDALLDHYMEKSGMVCADPRVKRVLGLVAQKFVSDVATDAHEYYKMRQQTLSAKEKKQQQGKSKGAILTNQDLCTALSDYGVDARKPHLYA